MAPVLTERREATLPITINRPGVKNALDRTAADRIAANAPLAFAGAGRMMQRTGNVTEAEAWAEVHELTDASPPPRTRWRAPELSPRSARRSGFR